MSVVLNDFLVAPDIVWKPELGEGTEKKVCVIMLGVLLMEWFARH